MVILTYLAGLSAKLYFSVDVLVPLLFPENTFEKLLPSVETDIVKIYWRLFPSAHATSTLHIDLLAPKSTLIHGLTLNVDHHLVFALLSMALLGGNEP